MLDLEISKDTVSIGGDSFNVFKDANGVGYVKWVEDYRAIKGFPKRHKVIYFPYIGGTKHEC